LVLPAKLLVAVWVGTGFADIGHFAPRTRAGRNEKSLVTKGRTQNLGAQKPNFGLSKSKPPGALFLTHFGQTLAI
jgi:hypothetical protein